MKKIISFLLIIVILASITTSLDFTAKAANLPSSGWCSTTAKFTFNKKNGLLTISGKGAINRQVFYGKSQIKKVVVKKGITQIGQREFKNCINLNTLELPNGLTFIGKEAFSNTAYYKNRSNWKNNTLYYKKYLLKANDEHFEKIHNNAIYSKNCIYRYTVKKGTVLIAERAIPVYKNTSCSHLHITLNSFAVQSMQIPYFMKAQINRLRKFGCGIHQRKRILLIRILGIERLSIIYLTRLLQ